MKEQFKTPERELSDEEIDNLSDAEFKTLTISMLTEIIDFGRKMKEEMKAIQSEIKEMYRESTVKERILGLKSMIWNKRNKYASNRTEFC